MVELVFYETCLKGQISELELHLLRGRLTEGILSKAKRGDLA
jgi:DNA invertase Pin-like site-specific DNA recombinase